MNKPIPVNKPFDFTDIRINASITSDNQSAVEIIANLIYYNLEQNVCVSVNGTLHESDISNSTKQSDVEATIRIKNQNYSNELALYNKYLKELEEYKQYYAELNKKKQIEENKNKGVKAEEVVVNILKGAVNKSKGLDNFDIVSKLQEILSTNNN